MSARLPLTAALAATLAFPGAAWAGPRIAIFVGNNDGGSDRASLRYAERDAIEMQRVLHGLGAVSTSRLLLGQGPADLRRAIETLSEETRSAEGRPTLFFYYSGHADDLGILMGDERFGFRELRSALESFPAPLFVAVIDACQSGRVTRQKGGVPVPVLDVALQEDGKEYRGSVFITSGAWDEAAQESDEVEASFFTHFLIAGLRGAADDSGDRRVSLEEAYRFAYRHTVERTRGTLIGPQHPTYDVDLSGRGQLVLTWLSVERGYLLLPASSQGRYQLRRDDGSTAIAEVAKAPGKALRIALEPGRYEVARREAAHDLVQMVNIGRRGEWPLDETRMIARPHRSFAQKGGGPATTVTLGYHLQSGFLVEAAPRHALRATVLTPIAGFHAGGYFLAGTSAYARSDGLDVSVRELGAGAVGEISLLRAGKFSLAAGAEGGLVWIWQRGSLGAGRAATLSAATAPFAVRIALELTISAHWSIIGGPHAGATIFEGTNGVTAKPLLGGEIGLRLTP